MLRKRGGNGLRVWLKTLRSKRNYSQTVMADKLEMTRQAYCQIENGQRQNDLPLSLMVKISDVFNITLDDIKNYELAK